MPKRSTPWWLIPVAVMAAAAGMGLLGLWQLGAAEQLSSLLRGQRIQQRIETILMPSGAAAATQLHDGAQRLVDEAELGLVYVSLASGSGEVVAVAGRFEKWDFGVLPRSATRGLRQLAYRWAGRAQLVEWPADAAWPYGARIRFVVAPGIGQPPDAAVSRLAWSGTLSFLLGLLAALPVPTLWRRAIRPPTPWAERLAPEARPGHGPVDIEQRVYEQLPERLGDWLDQLDQALIVVDSEASVRYLNETAGALTGWAPADVQGRLVYSVFHPLDSRYSPMLTPVEICLRDEAPYAASELRLRARDGTQRSIEVMAVPVRRPSGLLDGALMVFHDISNREKRIDQWRRQARNAQSVVDHLTEGVLTTDPVGVIRFANAHALRMFGYVWEELDGVTVSKLMPVPFLNSPSVRLTDYIGGEGAVGLPKVVGWRRDATTFPVELVVQNMTIEHAQGLLVIVRDITERLRSDNLAQRLGRLLDAAAEEVYIFDAQTLRFVEINRGARRNLGYHASEMTNMTPLVISEQIDTETYQHYLNRLRDGEAEHVTYRCQHRRADGSAYPVEVRLNYSREEEPPVFMAIAVDITEREAAEQRLQYLAHHDALTGLPNRAMLADRLNQAMLATLRSSRLLGLLYLDVDHFKQINDQHGHDAGDRVLKQVAERLQRLVRASDTIARLGGDEFVLVLPGLRHEHDALALGDKIVDAFAAPVRLNDNLSIRIGASVGAVICPRGERDAERDRKSVV
jgi:diguanylate cyclase (GGDEF)-like protein/PAS domain S-box-containing protein